MDADIARQIEIGDGADRDIGSRKSLNCPLEKLRTNVPVAASARIADPEPRV